MSVYLHIVQFHVITIYIVGFRARLIHWLAHIIR